jgi:hypothetical protein
MKQRAVRPLVFFLALLALGGAVAAGGVDPVSRRDAARLQAKIDQINRNVAARRPGAAVRTPVTEAELNSYLKYEMGDRIPAGVTDPWVSIVGDSRVAGRATVDLNQVSQKHKSTGMLDPYNYLTGSVPVTANGMLTSKNGVASFTLESAAISGVPVPVWMLQEIVASYSKTPATPQGVSIDKPFPLPAGIREIQIDPGQAIVIQ